MIPIDYLLLVSNNGYSVTYSSSEVLNVFLCLEVGFGEVVHL